MSRQRKTIGQILDDNERRYAMARQGTMGGGGPSGSTPLGDRPGTTTAAKIRGGWSSSPAGRAKVIAIGMFVMFTFVHVAAESRYTAA